MKYLFLCCLMIISFVVSAQSGIWAKLYGDASRNTPRAVKSFDDGVYLAARVVRPGTGNGDTYATFTKFNQATGQLDWELELDFPSEINDFVYVPDEDAFILVGRSNPFGAFINSTSFILKVDDNGVILLSREIEQNGREELTRIVRHEAPVDAMNRYYAVGTFTPNGAGNEGRDLTVLFNFSENLVINWRKEYPAVDGQEIEGARGLFTGLNGELFLLGNDIKWNNTDLNFANNNGTMIHVRGNGDVLRALYYPGEIDWWAGKNISGKIGALAGHRFGADEGYVGLADLTNGAILYGLRFPELKEIRNLVVIGNARRGVILFAATLKDNARHENHLVLIEYDLLAAVPLVVRRVARHEEVAEAVAQPWLNLNETTNLLVYADGRRPVGDPSFESLVQGMGPDLATDCLLELTGVSDTMTLQHIPFDVEALNGNYLTDTFTIMAPDPDLDCRVTCGPDTCILSFNATVVPVNGCYEVNLVATPSGGQGPYIVNWNIDCGAGAVIMTGNLTTPYTFPPAQDYTICVDIVDANGCTDTIMISGILDNVPPACPFPFPPVVSATAGPCEQAVQVSFPDPVFVDNCAGPITVVPTSTPTSGDLFGVGSTPVMFTGTDAAGNSSDCFVNVVVSKDCGQIVSSALNCRGGTDYQLVIDFNNSLPLPITACTYSVLVNETFVTQTGPIQFVNGMLVVDIFSNDLFLEATATVQLVSNCPCPNGDVTNCSFTFEAPVECCLELSVPDTVICSDETTLQLPIVGINQLISPYNIQQVRYYVSNPPCTFGGPAFQLTNGYQPLTLAPNFHDGNICVYAEVDLAGGGACSTIRTEIATVQRCDLVTGAIPNQRFCFDGTPIVPAPLVLTLGGGDPNLCGADIQWFDPDGNPILNANGLTYQPNVLSLPSGTMACDERFTYRAEITSICGVSSATATIRLFNDDAPLGDLTIEAPDVPPLCPGEDAVIRYDPACTGDDMMWQWWERTANTTFTALPTNGSQNPVYFTNRLYEDTWYQVTKTNGSCPEDRIEIFVDVADPLLITSFTVDYNVACQPDFLNLNVSFTSQPTCVDSIFYYRDGLLLAVQPAATPAYVFDPIDDDISGNYYAVVRDTCCNVLVQTAVIAVENPPSIDIAGPCFLCNSDENDLPSTLVALPTGVDLADVTLEWFVDGVPFGPPNAPTVDIFDDDGNVFTLEMTTASGCVYTASFTPYKRCFVVGVDDLVRVQGKVFPNPATDHLVIETDQQVRFREITLYDVLGRPVKTAAQTGLVTRTTISLVGLPKGLYILQAFTESGALLAREIIRE